jgi:GT2 family glycosyltransferase
MPRRPPVSLVVPFLGDEAQLERLLGRLAVVETRPGDEVIVADNRETQPSRPPTRPVTLHPAGGIRSPGFARNRGAAVAAGEWLVFIDADTVPEPRLLDLYFDPVPRPTTAVLGGGVLDVLPAAPVDPESRGSRVARRVVTRGQMSHRVTLERPDFPYAQTANCAIRREAFLAAGGFDETVRAAEDADLCLRLAEQGWGLEVRPAALVRHEARQTLRELLAQLARHGAGAAWCNRRHPGSFPPAGPAGLARRLGGAAVTAARASVRGEREAAADAALELLEAGAFELGRLLPNRARR